MHEVLGLTVQDLRFASRSGGLKASELLGYRAFQALGHRSGVRRKASKGSLKVCKFFTVPVQHATKLHS